MYYKLYFYVLKMRNRNFFSLSLFLNFFSIEKTYFSNVNFYFSRWIDSRQIEHTHEKGPNR